jgi:hypothetical protein
MADENKQSQQASAPQRKDPTVTTAQQEAAPDYPEGTHPARTASEVTHSAQRLHDSVRDAGDDEKPDPTTVAQLQDVPEDFPGQGIPQSEVDAAAEGGARDRAAGDKRRGGE